MREQLIYVHEGFQSSMISIVMPETTNRKKNRKFII